MPRRSTLLELADTPQRQLTVLAYAYHRRDDNRHKAGFNLWVTTNKVCLRWSMSQIGATFRALQERGLIEPGVGDTYSLTEQGSELIVAHFRALGFMRPTFTRKSMRENS